MELSHTHLYMCIVKFNSNPEHKRVYNKCGHEKWAHLLSDIVQFETDIKLTK